MPLQSTFMTTTLGNFICNPDPSTGWEKKNPGLLLQSLVSFRSR